MESNELIDQSYEVARLLGNPFPGLRPFSFEESHLFFGREGQSDEVLEKLSANRFVAILGASGSGKSSLMFCGLIPILYGGFLTSAGSNWRIITTRPGISPIDNLSVALTEKLPDFGDLDEDEKLIRKTIMSTLLRSTSLGLIEAVKQAKLGKNEAIFIMIDQFEELFRYRRSSGNPAAVEESLAFVKLILEAVSQKELPIYVALTMRSDFIGDCAQYPDLTKKINDSHYLIPQMTREQKRLAIVGPVAVGGGKITPRLVQRLLNDVGDSPDQLPILQHSLMRTWDFWKLHPEEGEFVDVPHYESIGTITEALSNHANEAYDELSEREKLVCESMFKTLTEKSVDNIGIRRPTKLKDIATIARVMPEEIIPVIEKFRSSGRSLLMPPAGVALDPDTVIDISHESLMRIWIRLKKWVEQESESVQMYLRLCEASAMYQLGKAGLWRNPDLQLALNWKEIQQPSLTWAKQYNPAFERAMVFLETSKKAFEEEEANKERLQKKRLRQVRITAMILGSAAVISLIFLVIAIDQRTKAINNEKRARDQEKAAIEQRNEAERQKQIAIEQQRIAEEQRGIAEEQKTQADIERENAKRSALVAREKQKLANINAAEANRQRIRAEEQTVEAVNQKKRAEKQKSIAENEKERADQLRVLSIARSMAIKSLQIKDTAKKVLLAEQAFLFNKEYQGRKLDHDIYDGLYYAYKYLNGDDFNLLKGHSKAVRSIRFSPESGSLFSGGSDGRIIQWDLQNRVPKTSTQAGFLIRDLALSPDGNLVAVGGESNKIKIYKSDLSLQISSLPVEASQTWNIQFLNNTTLVSSGTDNTLLRWNLSSLKADTIAKLPERIHSFVVDPDKLGVYAGTEKGNLIYIDLTNGRTHHLYDRKGNKSIDAIAISKNGDQIVFGDEAGTCRIFYLKEKKVLVLRGHRSRINDIKFSQDEKLLATASFDGTVRLWDLTNLNDQPVVLSDNSSWVWAVCFDPLKKELIAGCVDNTMRAYPTEMQFFTTDICEKLDRNLSEKEWKQYVAKDIPYRKTCKGLPKGKENSHE